MRIFTLTKTYHVGYNMFEKLYTSLTHLDNSPV